VDSASPLASQSKKETNQLHSVFHVSVFPSVACIVELEKTVFCRETKMAIPLSNGLRALFSVLGCLMVATLIYTIYVDGFPFRRDLLTP
jgi:hypothetical protein